MEEIIFDAPLALKQMVDLSNEKLKLLQNELVQNITDASEELMQLMQLNPNDGWRLDLHSMKFIKVPTPSEDTIIDAPISE